RSAPLSNWIASSIPMRWLMDVLFGLDRRRVPPKYSRQTFFDWWEADRSRYETSGEIANQRFVLFGDTFTNFHEPAIPIAAVKLASAAGWSVTIPPRVCCGRPLISKGFLAEAAQQAEKTVRALQPFVEGGQRIVFCEPGCYSAVRDDHPHLLRGELQQQAR